ncbi:lipase family protein [Hyalangium minutum]|uniref:Lipase n=1 Tax=Hyalangium minutum TaxID=394096 RepID=A0A085W8H3_9BACT|nr:lipase family protein [Hyalangium minutum]KFE63986.1 Lipase [Hyalangium minutum]
MQTRAVANTSSAPTYSPTLALAFANAVEAAYNFYDNGTPISLAGYTIGPDIYVFELEKKTFFGYVATGTPPNSGIPQHNLVVFRGTRTKEEGFYDMDWSLVPGNLGGQAVGNVAKGLYDFYTGAGPLEKSLSQLTLEAISWFSDTSLPLYVCGHSLGGGVATLASLDIVLNNAYTAAAPIMYTYGGLHAGDQNFVTAFSTAVAAAFRVTNLADFVPQLTGLAADNTQYVHVGEQWWFVAYNSYLWENHELSNTYLTALTSYPSQVVNTPPPNFPASGA